MKWLLTTFLNKARINSCLHRGKCILSGFKYIICIVYAVFFSTLTQCITLYNPFFVLYFIHIFRYYLHLHSVSFRDSKYKVLVNTYCAVFRWMKYWIFKTYLYAAHLKSRLLTLQSKHRPTGDRRNIEWPTGRSNSVTTTPTGQL